MSCCFQSLQISFSIIKSNTLVHEAVFHGEYLVNNILYIIQFNTPLNFGIQCDRCPALSGNRFEDSEYCLTWFGNYGRKARLRDTSCTLQSLISLFKISLFKIHQFLYIQSIISFSVVSLEKVIILVILIIWVLD